MSQTVEATRQSKNAVGDDKLSPSHHRHCCEERGLNSDWIKASCESADIKEASEYLHYKAKSPGILI